MSGIWLASYIALWVLVALLAVVVLGLVRQLGLIHLRLGPEEHLLSTNEGLELGSSAPEFHELDIINEQEISMADLKGQQSILVFVSSDCSPCLELFPYLAEFQHNQDGKVNIILVGQGKPQEYLNLKEKYNLDLPMIIDIDGKVTSTYLVRATPFAYCLDEEGLIRGRGIVNDLEGLTELVKKSENETRTIDLPS